MLFETERMEFKELWTDHLYKEVIAFANTGGGTILVGVNDRGESVGMEDVDDVYTRITNGIRDAISPDITVFVKYALVQGEVIRIEVGEGTYKPYYLKAKGLKPTGVYVRHGASSVPASSEQIRQMIKTTDDDAYEDLRALLQDLTFDTATSTFTKHQLNFGTEKYFQLGVQIAESQQFTNLGLLLSDQCFHTVKVAVFADDKKTVFRDRKEFCGSLFGQLEETYDYLQLCNQNRSVIDGLEREDYWDFPKSAIREALLNALIHRDYSFSGSTIINISETEMEFVSMGGLVAGLTSDDIRNGISQSRNRKLAEVFHRLNFIEAYGTGIRRIFALYESCTIQPTIEVTPNSFKLILPNMNVAGQNDSSDLVAKRPMTAQMKSVLDYLAAYGEINDLQFQELLCVKRTRAYLIAKEMLDAGLIRSAGRGKQRKYLTV